MYARNHTYVLRWITNATTQISEYFINADQIRVTTNTSSTKSKMNISMFEKQLPKHTARK